MPFTKMIRTLMTGLIWLCGGLILVGLAVWLHYWLSAIFNPAQVRPFENWSLTLGLAALLIQLSASIEALIISVGMQFRWIRYQPGRIAVGVFSSIALAYTLSKIWLIATGPGIGMPNIFILLLVELLLLVPLVIAGLLMKFFMPLKSSFESLS